MLPTVPRWVSMLGNAGSCSMRNPEMVYHKIANHSIQLHRKGKDMNEQKTRTEEFQVDGDMLVAKIKELIREGNIRRIVIKNEEGRILIDIPLTMGVVGALIAPQLAALGAIAALVTHGTIVVEKVEG